MMAVAGRRRSVPPTPDRDQGRHATGRMRPEPVRTARGRTPRPSCFESSHASRRRRGQLVAALAIRKPLGRSADGVHVDDAPLPGSKHGPHPRRAGGLGGVLGTYVEGGAGRRGVSSHELGARSLETAGVGIRRIGEPPLRARRRRRNPAGFHLLRCSIATYAIADNSPSIGICDADRAENDEWDDHPGRHGTDRRKPVNQPMRSPDRQERARRDVAISRAGVPDRASAR